MPLFMLISGFLFYKTQRKHTVYSLIKNRIYSLLIPIASCTIIWSIINLKFTKADLWFLWALLYLSLITTIISRKYNDKIKFYMIIFFLFFFITDSSSWSIYKFMYPFFITGYLLNKHNKYLYLINITKKTKYYLITLSALLFLILIYFYNKDIYIYTTGYKLFRFINLNGHLFLSNSPLYQLFIDIYRFLTAFIGCFFIINIMRLIYDNTKNKKIFAILIHLGKYSLGIYIIQEFILFPILSHLTINLIYANYFINLLECIFITIICLCITKLLKFTKITNLLFLGGRR